MKIQARVERPGFKQDGARRAVVSIVYVSRAVYDQYGPRGTSHLSFVAVREDLDDHPDARVNATPEALALANAEGVALRAVHGTGAGGKIKVGDVRKAIAKNS